MALKKPKTPYPRSYWVMPGLFLAGYFPGDKERQVAEEKLCALLDCGIRSIINLMEEDEKDHSGHLFIPYESLWSSLGKARGTEVFYRRVPMQDLSIPAEVTMIAALDLIDCFLVRHVPVYVHCWGGRGRTGTVVGCWLARQGIASGQKVLENIGEMRKDEETHHKPSPETPQQIRMVLSWQKGQ